MYHGGCDAEWTLGLGEGSNLFVEPDGSWRKDSYVPAYVRAFPFIFVEDPNSKTVYVGMEEGADCVRPDSGQAMFLPLGPSVTSKLTR